MLLSVLIPTRNYTCVQLCEEISRQLDELGEESELIVIDDCSVDSVALEENRKINAIKYCRVIELKENVGIAAIRNLLAKEAKGEYLLFLDSDVYPTKSDFIKTYLAKKHTEGVLCGGLTYRLNGPVKLSPLRYEYGMKYEASDTARFISLNFFVKADLFRQIKFDERFSRYGHEDTKFGMDVERLGYRLHAIQNAVYHDNGDTSEAFLRKTRIAVDNLVEHKAVLKESSRLLQLHERIERFHLGKMFSLPYAWSKGMMEKNLLGEHPSLFIYNVYRLSYLCRRMQEKNV